MIDPKFGNVRYIARHFIFQVVAVRKCFSQKNYLILTNAVIKIGDMPPLILLEGPRALIPSHMQNNVEASASDARRAFFFLETETPPGPSPDEKYFCLLCF